MFTFVLIVHVIISILLILVILLQVGRGAEMGAAFGSVGQAQFAAAPENILGKFTTILAILFMLLSLTLAIMSSSRSSASVLDSVAPLSPATDTNSK